MIVVKAQPGDSSDSVIKKFTRKVIAEGLLLELKQREFYQKPAEKRKEQKKEIQRRIKYKKTQQRLRKRY